MLEFSRARILNMVYKISANIEVNNEFGYSAFSF